MKFNRIIELSDEGINLASRLDAGQLDDIGKAVAKGYRDGLDSRREWENRKADALTLALPYYERQAWPGEGGLLSHSDASDEHQRRKSRV